MKKLKASRTHDAEAKRRFEKTSQAALSEMKGLDFDNSGGKGMELKGIEQGLFHEPAVVMRNDDDWNCTG